MKLNIDISDMKLKYDHLVLKVEDGCYKIYDADERTMSPTTVYFDLQTQKLAVWSQNTVDMDWSHLERELVSFEVDKYSVGDVVGWCRAFASDEKTKEELNRACYTNVIEYIRNESDDEYEKYKECQKKLESWQANVTKLY